MLRRLGLTIVACGVMLGIAGAANAAVMPAKITNRSTVQRVAVHPHRTTVRRGVHRTHIRRHASMNTSLKNTFAGRWHRGFHRHNFRVVGMV